MAHLTAISNTSEALSAELRRAGGGNAVFSKTDNAGQENSVNASAAAPSSQLKNT
jgi:hypothetical protein